MDTITCQRCDRVLDPDTAVWLELDTHTGLYHDDADDAVVPFPADGLSQGWLPFGVACAHKELSMTDQVAPVEEGHGGAEVAAADGFDFEAGTQVPDSPLPWEADYPLSDETVAEFAVEQGITKEAA